MATAGIRADSTAPAKRSQARITRAGLIRFPPSERIYFTGSYNSGGVSGMEMVCNMFLNQILCFKQCVHSLVIMVLNLQL